MPTFDVGLCICASCTVLTHPTCTANVISTPSTCSHTSLASSDTLPLLSSFPMPNPLPQDPVPCPSPSFLSSLNPPTGLHQMDVHCPHQGRPGRPAARHSGAAPRTLSQGRCAQPPRGPLRAGHAAHVHCAVPCAAAQGDGRQWGGGGGPGAGPAAPATPAAPAAPAGG